MAFDPDDLERLRSGELDLSHCNFEGADLSGLDLRGRNFARSRLTQANLSDADLRGAALQGGSVALANLSRANMSRTDLSSVHFSNAKMQSVNLSGSILKKSVFNNVDLSGANLEGADFTGAQFNGNMKLENIVFNEFTVLDGVRGLRSLAKFELFKGYVFDDGTYRREAGFDEIVSTDLLGRSDKVGEGRQQFIQYRIKRNVSEIRIISANLSLLISEHRDHLISNKPNDPDGLERFQDSIDFLDKLASGLAEISAILQGVDGNGDGSVGEIGRDSVSRAGRIVENLSVALEDYTKSDGRKFISTGMIGLASGLFYLCGASGDLAFAAAAALIGGPDMVSTAGKLIFADRGKAGK